VDIPVGKLWENLFHAVDIRSRDVDRGWVTCDDPVRNDVVTAWKTLELSVDRM
jgi:hypothetical protein